ncbi:MAG TPA: serine hydrolase domain-containing protein [Terriglobales bacterium]|nr:serine hydrolase domain-containing protein [Terriglobales bacterium]
MRILRGRVRSSYQLPVTIYLVVILVVIFLSLCALAQNPSFNQQVDRVAHGVLASTGVPSASVAIVRDDQIAYVHNYGDARLDPRVPARPEMRYSVGSISKQFTATAILMLADRSKLSLDDPVSRFLPDLTRAGEVTIRQLLSHTSGYQDYWPQDYVMPMMLQPVTAQKILDLWARKPLDFEPGTKWQYSNTNYVIAGLIVEKASGMPLLKFLADEVFKPLGMENVVNIDQERLADTDPTGYMRYALGPLHPAPKEGKGWLFAAGELAMSAPDLARWDIGMLQQRLLKPASYKEMQTEVLLKNGLGTRYGLGVDVTSEADHRAIEHGGEVSGFTSENIVFPDDRAAVVVLTNQDAALAAGQIARRIAPLLFQDAHVAEKEQQARNIFTGLQHGQVDRLFFTANANSYFTPQALTDFAASLGPLGAPQLFTQASQGLRGGMSFRRYTVTFPKKQLSVWVYEMPDGKIEEYQVMASD